MVLGGGTGLIVGLITRLIIGHRYNYVFPVTEQSVSLHDMRETYTHCVKMVVLIMMLGMPLNAQTAKGSIEIGIIAGPYFFMENGGHEPVGGFGISGEPHVDYFINDRITVGATGFFYSYIENDPSQHIGGVYSHMNYYFNSNSTFSPYIGGRIGVVKGNSDLQFAFGIQTGLLYFVSSKFSINGQLDIVSSTGPGFLSSLDLGLSYHIK